MIDDQLTAALEQIEQACLAIGTSKTYSLSILTIGIRRRLAFTRSRCFVSSFRQPEVLFAQPLFSRYNFRMRYGVAFHDDFCFDRIDYLYGTVLG